MDSSDDISYWAQEYEEVHQQDPDRSNPPGLWRRRDGSMISIRHMDDRHLSNAIRFLEKRAPTGAKLYELVLEFRLREVEKRLGIAT